MEEFGDLLDEFDEAYRVGATPDIDTFLIQMGAVFPRTDPVLPKKAIQIFEIAMEHEWKALKPRYLYAEDFLRDYPGIGDQVVDLAIAEYEARSRIGQPPDPAEYRRRFAGHWQELEGRIHQVVPPNSMPGMQPSNSNGYELGKIIESGGMGSVYRALDLEIGRDVAVKFLLDKDSLDFKKVARFMGEARITGQLQHSGIPVIYRMGTWGDGRPFLAMRHIKGHTLKKLLSDGPIDDVLLNFEAVCKTVGYAHKQRVIHRDLKPDNIMVTDTGEVQVIDWGLAKVLDAPSNETGSPDDETEEARTEIRTRHYSDVNLSADIEYMGTLCFMSPEQASGKHAEVDRRSDVFSLGAILCRILTGVTLYEGKTADEIRHNATRGSMDRAEEELNNCNREPELIEICLKCLKFNPDDRYADADELANAVAQIRIAAEERARQAEVERGKAEVRFEASARQAEVERGKAEERLAEKDRKRKRELRFVAAIFLSLVLGVASSIFFLDRADRARIIADDRSREIEKVLGQSRKIHHEDALRTAYLKHEKGLDYDAFLWFAAASMVPGLTPEDCEADRALFGEWMAGMPLTVRARTFEPTRIRQVEYHPKRPLLLVRLDDGRAGLWDLPADHYRELDRDKDVTAVAWSADGMRLAVARRSGDGGATVDVLAEPFERIERSLPAPGNVYCLGFSPDGTILAGAGAQLSVWRGADCAIDHSPVLRDEARILVFSPNGDLLIVSGRSGVSFAFKISEGRHATVPDFELPHISEDRDSWWEPIAPTFIKNGSEIVTDAPRAGLQYHRAEDGKRLGPPDAERQGGYTSLVARPDGSTLAVGRLNYIDLLDAKDPSKLLATFPTRNFNPSVHFSPDGRLLLASGTDRKIRLLQVQADSFQEYAPPIPLDEPRLVRFSPDGGHFVTVQFHGLIRVWSMPSIRPRSIPGVASRWTFFAADLPGERIVTSGTHRTGNRNRELQVHRVHPFGPEGRGIFLDSDAASVEFLGRGPEIAVCVAPSGTSKESRLEIWNTQSGVRKWACDLPSPGISIAVTPQQDLLAVMCRGGETLIFDLVAHKLLHTCIHEPCETIIHFIPERRLAFTKDGRTLIGWGMNKTIAVWDVRTGQAKYAPLSHGGICFRANLSQDETKISSASADGHAVVWDLATGRKIAVTPKHPDWVFQAKLDPAGDRLLTASKDGLARIWNFQVGEPKPVVLMDHEEEVYDATFSPDGKVVWGCGKDGFLRAWDARTGKPVYRPIALPGWGFQVRAGLAGNSVAVGGAFGAPLVFSIDEAVRPDLKDFDDRRMKLLGEVMSMQRLTEEGGVENLSINEWFKKWKKLEDQCPTLFSDKWPGAEATP